MSWLKRIFYRRWALALEHPDGHVEETTILPKRRPIAALSVLFATPILALWYLLGTAGLSTANLANKLLDTLSNTSFAAGTQLFGKLHTGDPGASGTANASQHTTRQGFTWAAASAGSKALAATLPSWSIASLTSPTTETITHVSVWDNVSAGSFLYSFVITNKAVSNGDTLNLTSHSVSLSPLAA